MRNRQKQRALRRAKAHRKALHQLGEYRNVDPTFYEAMSNVIGEQSEGTKRQIDPGCRSQKDLSRRN